MLVDEQQFQTYSSLKNNQAVIPRLRVKIMATALLN